MKNLRVLSRVITYDASNQSILLVRNKNQKWWCAPGGGWDYEKETIIECAEREVFEETGIKVNILKFLYVQTLNITEQDSVWLEQFWLAEPISNTKIIKDHIDKFGVVDEARWFNFIELQDLVVYPKNIKENFFINDLKKSINEDNRYIGHFVL